MLLPARFYYDSVYAHTPHMRQRVLRYHSCSARMPPRVTSLLRAADIALLMLRCALLALVVAAA